ncbi:MAG: hypothetical protein ACUVX9_01710 [Anaerolineae bacterium]
MSGWRLLLRILASPRLPAGCRRLVVGSLASLFGRRLARQDARTALVVPRDLNLEGPVFLLDGYHGGVPFWDWLLPGDGLWTSFLWPVVGGSLLRRGLPVALELDGCTYQRLAAHQPATLKALGKAVACGWVELVNGTYAQPFLDTLAGEMVVRQFWHGLCATEEATGAQTVAYASQEPCFCAQMPQILNSFGYRWALVRTHWAAFGCERGFDAPLVRWQGPDGSEVLAVPRHTWQSYNTRKDVQPGVVRGTLWGGHASHWSPEGLVQSIQAAAHHGTAPPLLSKLEDMAPPDAPTAQAPALARAAGIRISSLSGYCEALLAATSPDNLPRWRPAPDDLILSLPWGLDGDRLLTARAAAEAALHSAERAAAVAFALGAPDAEAELRPAWEKLLLAQHHDLQVCGQWPSAAHGRSMSDVGCDLCREAEATAQHTLRQALSFLLGFGQPLSLSGRPLIVFNPLPRPLRALVRLSGKGSVRAGDRCLPVQVDGQETLVVCDLPALGWRVFELCPVAPQVDTDSVDGSYGEGRLVVTFCAGHLTVKSGERELVRDGIPVSYRVGGAWFDSRTMPAAIEVVANGSLFTRWRLHSTLGAIHFSQYLTLYRHLHRLDVDLELDFGQGVPAGPQPEDGEGYYARDEEKVCAVLQFGRGRLLRSLPFLTAETHLGRFTTTGWASVESVEGNLALLTQGSRGCAYDPEEGLLRLVLAWSPRRWIYDGGGRSQLAGRYAYRFALLPYKERDEAMTEAEQYWLPPVALVGESGARTGEGEGSLLAVEPDVAHLTALFVHDGALHVRLWNASSETTEVRIPSALLRPRLWLPVDLQLRAVGSPGQRFVMPPWGVQTLRLVQ